MRESGSAGDYQPSGQTCAVLGLDASGRPPRPRRPAPQATQVHRADALDALLAIDRADHIITDTPYSKRTYHMLGRERRADGTEPRQAMAGWLTRDDIDALAREMAKRARRWILLFTDEFDYGAWRESLEAHGARYIRQGVWMKSNPMPQMTGTRPAQGHELLLIAHGKARVRWNGGGLPATWIGPSAPPVRVVAGHRHANAKPAWLLERLIELYTDPGDLLVDPFCGSGETGVAAVRSGRRVIMSDRDPVWVSYARKRVDSQQRQLTLQVDG